MESRSTNPSIEEFVEFLKSEEGKKFVSKILREHPVCRKCRAN